MNRVFFCIDLKSFYASVECVDRGLDSLKTNLIVADISRGEGTICLAVSPALKKIGVKNRCRLFEVPKNIDFVISKPRMKRYIEVSADIYAIYLKYVAKEDILVYSIDECFLDVTKYLKYYRKDKYELAKMIMNDIYVTTGISASVGIGTNMFLSKVALDIKAKHDKDNIYFFDEKIFKEIMWNYRPLTDIFKIGKGISKRLAKHGIYDLEGITKIDSKILYKEFGVDAELLIDHAFGKESCTISEVHNYKKKSNSLSSGQVLFEDYTYLDALLIVKEMVELLLYDLVDNNLITNNISLSITYSKDSIKSRGSVTLDGYTDSLSKLTSYFIDLYNKIVKKNLLIRKIGIGFNHLKDKKYQDIDLFSYEKEVKENKVEKTLIEIKKKYGKNAVFKGMNLSKKGTTIKRNKLVGGHNAR